MHVPQISSLETALRVYYSYPEVGNAEITQLFGRHASDTIACLKKAAKDEMLKRGVPSYGAHKVNTTVAFEVWGLDPVDLEKRLAKLKKLND
jgi:hypothetical protein